jgi:diguanylate cyclase (GGDEF)-like protein
VPPPTGDVAVTSALPRCCFGLAGLATADAVLLVAQSLQFTAHQFTAHQFTAHQLSAQQLSAQQFTALLLAAGHLLLALGAALVGWLIATRRLPGWRRERVFAGLLALATVATGIRAGGMAQPWQLAELPLLAGLAATVIAARPVAWAVIGAGPVVSLAAFGAALVPAADALPWQPWAHSLLVVMAGSLAGIGLQACREVWSQTLAAARQASAEQAVRDPVTGVANRRGLEMVAQPMLQHARRDGQAVHCLVLDVDGLRRVNDQAGSRAGDEVLQCVAQALQDSVRTTDVVARWAQDQFVMIGPGTGSSPLELERRIRSLVSRTNPVPEQIWNGRVSVGSATLVPWDDGDLGSLLGRAESDMALRRSLRRKAEAAQDGRVSR